MGREQRRSSPCYRGEIRFIEVSFNGGEAPVKAASEQIQLRENEGGREGSVDPHLVLASRSLIPADPQPSIVQSRTSLSLGLPRLVSSFPTQPWVSRYHPSPALSDELRELTRPSPFRPFPVQLPLTRPARIPSQTQRVRTPLNPRPPSLLSPSNPQ